MTPPPLSTPPRGARSAQLRAIAQWALGLGLTLGVAGLLAWAGVLLSVFGLAGVALVGGASFTVIGATVWRRGMLPMAVLSAALMLPAAAVAVGTLRLDRSVGLLEVRPSEASDLVADTYRLGSGTIFFDLRRMDFRPGTTTSIAAKADNGRIVVALPHDRCVATTFRIQRNTGYNEFSPVRTITDASLRMAGVRSAAEGQMSYGSMGMTEAPLLAEQNALQRGDQDLITASYGLLAYGRNPLGLSRFGDRYEWSRPVARAGAAVLSLDLSASQQIVVRDYPHWAAPLSDGNADGYDQVAAADWPTAVKAPVSPGNLTFRDRASVRTPANRERWLAWERRIVQWGTEQARRFAGPCATRQQLEVRGQQFTIQPEALKPKQSGGRAIRVAGTRRSTIEQPLAKDADSTFVLEVNGLGKVRFLGENRPDNPYGARTTRAQRELENAG